MFNAQCIELPVLSGMNRGENWGLNIFRTENLRRDLQTQGRTKVDKRKFLVSSVIFLMR